MQLRNASPNSDDTHRMSKSAYLRIGELLVLEGFLSPEQLEEALLWRSRTKARLGEVLSELGFVREENVIAALAKQFDHPMIDLSDFTAKFEAIELVPQQFAIEHVCLPLWIDERGLHIAIADPLGIHTINAMYSWTKLKLNVHLATPADIKRAINRSYIANSIRSAKPKHARRQKDRDELLELLAAVEPSQSELSVAA